MKRKFLEDLGLEKDTVDKIMAENGKDIESAKGDLDEITKERDQLKSDVNERDKQIEGLKKSAGDNEELKKQITDLQAENKRIRVDFAIDKALTSAKAKNNTAVKALLKNLDKAELADDGTVKGLDDQIKALQKDDSTKFLFDMEKPAEQPKLTGLTPASGKDDQLTQITKEQFSRMNYYQRKELKDTSPDLYKSLVDADQ